MNTQHTEQNDKYKKSSTSSGAQDSTSQNQEGKNPSWRQHNNENNDKNNQDGDNEGDRWDDPQQDPRRQPNYDPKKDPNLNPSSDEPSRH